MDGLRPGGRWGPTPADQLLGSDEGAVLAQILSYVAARLGPDARLEPDPVATEVQAEPAIRAGTTVDREVRPSTWVLARTLEATVAPGWEVRLELCRAREVANQYRWRALLLESVDLPLAEPDEPSGYGSERCWIDISDWICARGGPLSAPERSFSASGLGEATHAALDLVRRWARAERRVLRREACQRPRVGVTE